VIKKEVDVAIIGAGTAGMVAYREARKKTNNLVMIEGAAYGTTCARVGCMPSKLLIAAADASHHAKQASLFGIHIPNVDIDGKAVLERVRRERDRFVSFATDDIDSFNASHMIRGHAHFKDDHTLLIGSDMEIKAKRIIIAVGSRPFISDTLQKAGKRLLTNEDIFELQNLPKSVLISGTGVIGLELGQALNRLGVEVTMISRGKSIGGLADEEIQTYARKLFSKEMTLHFDTDIDDIIEHDTYVDVSMTDAEGTVHTKQVEYVLAAIGRVSNTDQLALEHTSLALNTRGLPEFNKQTMQTSVPHIFIAGDANNDLPLLHEASDEGYIAGKNAGSYPHIEPGKRRFPLGIIFSEPQISSIGARKTTLQDGDYIVGRVSFENQGRSRVLGVNKGLLKVYIDKQTSVFLGAEMFGPAAEHIGHLLAWAGQQGLSVKEILAMPFYHPVIEEAVRTVFRDANSKLSQLQRS
jgi:dihydrolipoamide dehydrogenase